MQNGTTVGESCGDMADLEKQGSTPVLAEESREQAAVGNHTSLTIVICNGESCLGNEPVGKFSEAVDIGKDEVLCADSAKKGYLSRTASSHEQCRVCQQEIEESLIDLGCQCRGGLAKAHRSCIDTWFRTKGSNKCEICQGIAANVSPPEPLPHTSYWVWRVDPTFRGSSSAQQRERGCFSPLWVAFSILIGGLLLDVLISITLGVSALPVNIIIGVIVVLGLGTAIRLAIEFCHEWSMRRVVQSVETNVNLGYHPGL